MTSTTLLKQLRSANYRLLGLVGQGQFGQVYCAIHRKTGRLVALKNLNRDRFPTHQFLRELRFLLSLNHPHIANCLALEHSNNSRQLVLDYCEGGTLRDILEQETQLTLAEILTLITEVLEALEHAQSAKIVHCDIKPENILLTLTPDGWQAKVSDFGIARLSQEFQGNRLGATGSPAYMAPERFYRQYSVSSDLYAIGVVLYELLLGDRPFSGNYDQLMVAHLNHPVKVPKTLPVAVRSLLSKALEKLVARRFHSAADMKAAIVTTRQTLTAAELRDRFPKPLATVPRCSCPVSQPVPLPATCQAITIVCRSSETATLMGHSDKMVWSWSLVDAVGIHASQPDQTWDVPASIQQVMATTGGAIAITDHAFYQLNPGQASHRFVSFEEAIEAVTGGHRWIMAQDQGTCSQFSLVDTWGKVPQCSHQFHLAPQQGQRLSLFDDRHLLLANIIGQKTELTILTRWGKRYGQITLNLPIHALAPSTKPQRALAQAGSQRRDLLIIQFKPYRIIRCRLDITPDWMGELLIGIAAISRNGHLRLVNLQGQIIGQVEGLPIPDAIAFHPPYHIWLSSHQMNQPQLYCIDVRDLDLDIVF